MARQVRPGLAQALVQPPLRGDVREGGDDGTRLERQDHRAVVNALIQRGSAPGS